MTDQSQKAIINVIVAGYFEPYEIAIATGTNITSDMIVLCARDNWIWGARAIIREYPANDAAIIMAINHKNDELVALLMSHHGFIWHNEMQIIFALAANDSPLLFECDVWKYDIYPIRNAMDGASSVNNVDLMQDIYNRAYNNGIYYMPVATTAIKAGHIAALQMFLDWGADVGTAFDEAVRYNQTGCMQSIYDFNPECITNCDHIMQHAMYCSSFDAMILIRKLGVINLHDAFTLAIMYDNHTAMRMIHNWGGSHDDVNLMTPHNQDTIDLLEYLKIGFADF